MSEVYVVTMPELGWDCVVGVFDADSVSLKSLEEVFPEGEYVIHGEYAPEKDLIDYQEAEE